MRRSSAMRSRVLLGLVERAVGAQLRFDLVVGGQRLGVRRAELARRLALGEREVVDAVLGHDARRGGGDALRAFRLASALAAHGCDSIIESRPSMAAHLHILGICGTFMGGIAAIAKAAGYRVTGCDANVYPPMSDQLAALGIELTEGFGAEPARARARRVGGRQRGDPRQPADGSDPRRAASATSPARNGSPSDVLAGKHVLAVAGTHGKTTDLGDARLDPRARRPQPRVS